MTIRSFRDDFPLVVLYANLCFIYERQDPVWAVLHELPRIHPRQAELWHEEDKLRHESLEPRRAYICVVSAAFLHLVLCKVIRRVLEVEVAAGSVEEAEDKRRVLDVYK